MKKILYFTLAIIIVLLSSCGNASKDIAETNNIEEIIDETPRLTSDFLSGVWEFTKGDLYKLSDKKTIQFEIYKGGTAKEVYESNSFNNFTWEISDTDSDVLNITMPASGMFSSITTGFTLDYNTSGTLRLQSVDGSVILTKSSDTFD